MGTNAEDLIATGPTGRLETDMDSSQKGDIFLWLSGLKDDDPQLDKVDAIRRGEDATDANGTMKVQEAGEPISGGRLKDQLSKDPGLQADDLMDSVELSRFLSVSTRTLRRMVSRGELPNGMKLGGRRVWIAGKVLTYLNEEAERQAIASS
jgi:predicted DNA-binding transcriptional regulator AlpA